MTLTNEYPMLDSASVVPVIESPFFQGELIINCKVCTVATVGYNNPEPSLEKFLADGWRLVQILWIRDESTNFGQAPAVHHVLKAVLVKTKKKEK